MVSENKIKTKFEDISNEVKPKPKIFAILSFADSDTDEKSTR